MAHSLSSRGCWTCALCRACTFGSNPPGTNSAPCTTHPTHPPTPLSLPRSCIPKNCPGADWRVLEEIVKADPSREKFKVGPTLHAWRVVSGLWVLAPTSPRHARGWPAQQRLMACRSASFSLLTLSPTPTAHPPAPSTPQGQPLVPWCLPNTADRHNGWRGLFGRLDWQGHFPTSTTDPQPMGKVSGWMGAGWMGSLHGRARTELGADRRRRERRLRLVAGPHPLPSPPAAPPLTNHCPPTPAFCPAGGPGVPPGAGPHRVGARVRPRPGACTCGAVLVGWAL